MSRILIAVIFCCFSAMVVESFFHSYKDGCDPNPCKHKATCKLTDPKDKTKYQCTCTSDYHGQNCSLEYGCSSKPCKHGAVCTNGILNKTDYKCACTGNYVGKKCDKLNACKIKSPYACKNGTCHIEPVSGEPYCECKPGWGSKHCDKLECNITEYKLKQSTKKSGKLFLDKALEPKIKQLDDLAKLCKVHLHIHKSYVQHPDKLKAHTYDIKDKNHHCDTYIGHAFSATFYDMKDNLLCNEVCLGKILTPVTEVKCFLDGLRAIKWQHHYNEPGVIHNDYRTLNGLVKYNKQREAVQIGCSTKKFV